MSWYTLLVANSTKSELLRMKNKYWLILIIAFTTIARLWNLGNPKGYVFDEVYHAFTAKAYANNDPRGYEWWHSSPEEGTAYEWLHPPVSKLFMGLSVYILGENSFAWRLPSALFGVLVIYLIYLLGRELSGSDTVGLVAAGLSSLDGLLLVQSRVAMNDIYVTAFILASLLFYLKWRGQENPKTQKIKKSNLYLLLSGIMTGLAIATKWTGVFLLPIVGAHSLYVWQQNKWKSWIKDLGRMIIVYGLMPVVIYVLSYSQFWLQGHTVSEFVELHSQIIRYQINLEATHPYQSKAWQWPLPVKPVWYSVDYSVEGRVGNIYALSNPIVGWVGLMTIAFVGWRLVKSKKNRSSDLLLVLSYFLIWGPWMLSPRIMFYYHYTPAIPLLAIAMAIFFDWLWKRGESSRGLVLGLVGLAVLAFVFFWPIWTLVPVDREFVEYFFWIPSWK